MPHVFDGGFEGAVHDEAVALRAEHFHDRLRTGQASRHHDHAPGAHVLLDIVGQAAHGVFVGIGLDEPIARRHAVFVEHHGQADGHAAPDIVRARRIDVVGVVEGEGSQDHMSAREGRVMGPDALVGGSHRVRDALVGVGDRG